jgi:glycosyltransferase involved in cell wall biosynthesis
MEQIEKVLYIVSRYPAISHTFIRDEVKGLRAMGAEVHTVTIRATDPSDLLSPDDREEAEQTKVVLPMSGRDAFRSQVIPLVCHPFAYLATLREALRRKPPGLRSLLWQFFYFVEAMVVWRTAEDLGVTHVHAHFANVACSVGSLATEFGRRVDHRTPSPWTFSFTMHGPTEFMAMEQHALGSKVESADFVICISDFCRSQLMLNVPHDHWHKLHVVHCGIDPERFRPAARPARAGAIRVLFVGRLVEAKGAPLLLDAVAELSRRGLQANVVLVGDGPLRSALQQQAESLGIAGAITFAGAVGHDRLSDFYEEADVFCLPSFAEGVPVVLMEAMATALPVVATNIAGIPELIDHDVSGILIPPGRVDLLADALLRLAEAPELRKMMGKAGRETVLSSFESSDTVRRVHAVFTCLIEPEGAIHGH